MKKKLLVIGAMSLVLAFTGCGNTNSGEANSVATQKEINPEEVLTNAITKLNETKSYEAVTASEFKLATQGQEVSMNMGINMKVINSPSMTMQLETNTKVAMAGQTQDVDIEMYLEPTDSGYTLYQNADNAWSKVSVTKEDLDAYIKIPSNSVNEYATIAKSITQGEDETVEGVDCYKLLVNIPASKIGDVMNEMGSMGENAESMLGNIAEGEDLQIEMFVSKADETLVQMKMDLADIMKNALKDQEGATEEDLESIEFAMTMSFSNIDGVSEIVIPEEAKSAPEM